MQIRILPVAVVAIVLSACAASPQKLPPRTAAAAQQAELSYDARIAAADRRAKEMGYHVETRHGEQFYCRTVAPIGSRLTQKECLTVDTMAQAQQMTEANQIAQRQAQSCQGGGCVVN
jgi:hypothetical protein